MTKLLWNSVALSALLAAPACAFQAAHPAPAYLSEDQIIDMMNHAQRWTGRTVTIRIYPYDLGASEIYNGTYVVCFEICSRDFAERSIFLVYTSPGRFGGYRGDRAAIIRARFDGACLVRYRPQLCPDLYLGKLTEILPVPVGPPPSSQPSPASSAPAPATEDAPRPRGPQGAGAAF